MKLLSLSRNLSTVVDDDVYEWASKFKWTALSNKDRPYAFRGIVKNGKNTTTYLHREIMKAIKGVDVDHINGDVLDNRKENLRLCSRSDNLKNQKNQRRTKSGLKGASQTASGKWQAKVGREYLGSFDTPQEAHEKYKTEASKIYGQFFRP